jgi:hypothetical protein
MPIVTIKKSNINLWEEYPDLDLIEEFKKLRKEEGDEKSNNILKAIYYIWDPKSDKRNSGFTESELIKDINANLLADKKFNWSKYEHIKEAWFKYCLTKTDQLLKEYEDQLDGLNDMMREWTWSKSDALDKAQTMKAYKGLFEEYADVKNKFTQEVAEREEMEGGYTLSMLESNVETA